MSQPPLNLFARRAEPGWVLERLRAAGTVSLTGTDGDWSRATLKVKLGFLKSATLTVSHSKAYYSGPDWGRQLDGMANYFAQIDERPPVQELVRGFRFALSFPDCAAPEENAPLEPVLRKVLRDLAHALDGVFFVPGVLFDRNGRILVGPEQHRHPDAEWPQFVGALSGVENHEPHSTDDDSEFEDAPPPTPERVAKRALVLSAMSARALSEINPDDGDMDALRRDLWSWVEESGLESELEANERAFLSSVEIPDEQHLVNAVWGSEGLAVLGWALRWWELPRYDQISEPPTFWKATHV
ncbi:MAG: DUF4272 domain-containing protein, partial [Myxococcota bacterium]